MFCLNTSPERRKHIGISQSTNLSSTCLPIRVGSWRTANSAIPWLLFIPTLGSAKCNSWLRSSGQEKKKVSRRLDRGKSTCLCRKSKSCRERKQSSGRRSILTRASSSHGTCEWAPSSPWTCPYLTAWSSLRRRQWTPSFGNSLIRPTTPWSTTVTEMHPRRTLPVTSRRVTCARAPQV